MNIENKKKKIGLKLMIRAIILSIKIVLMIFLAGLFALILQNFIVTLKINLSYVALIFALGLGFALGMLAYFIFRTTLLFPNSHKHSDDFIQNALTATQWKNYFENHQLRENLYRMSHELSNLKHENFEIKHNGMSAKNENKIIITISQESQ